GAPRCEELSPLRHARRAPRVAREVVRPEADPAPETGRTGRDEDRDARIEGRGPEETRERREERLAEDPPHFRQSLHFLPTGAPLSPHSPPGRWTAGVAQSGIPGSAHEDVNGKWEFRIERSEEHTSELQSPDHI